MVGFDFFILSQIGSFWPSYVDFPFFIISGAGREYKKRKAFQSISRTNLTRNSFGNYVDSYNQDQAMRARANQEHRPLVKVVWWSCREARSTQGRPGRPGRRRIRLRRRERQKESERTRRVWLCCWVGWWILVVCVASSYSWIIRNAFVMYAKSCKIIGMDTLFLIGKIVSRAQ